MSNSDQLITRGCPLPSPSTSKSIGLKDIADRAGVSVATVSMALSEHPDIKDATRERIKRISRDMGYRSRSQKQMAAARPPVVKRIGYHLVGASLEDSSHAHLLQAISNAARAAGCRVEMQATGPDEDPDHVCDELAGFARELDAVIVSGMVSAGVVRALNAADRPYVVVGGVIEGAEALMSASGQIVDNDEQLMGRLAITHLSARGCQRIAFVCERLIRGLWNDNWLRGFREGLHEVGRDVDDDLIHVAGEAFAGGGPAAAHFAALDATPDGYVVPDARVARSLVDALARHDIHPSLDTIVISGHKSNTVVHRLKPCPWIGFDTAMLGAAAVHQARSIAAERPPCTARILVPVQSQGITLRSA